jgi:hypothetical protein
MLKIVAAAGVSLLFGVSAASAGAPAFQPQTLVLENIPKAAGPSVSLFNGKDLDDWTAWLGYRDPAQTYLKDHDAPIGVAGKGDIFTVVMEDGAPALHVSGETWGSLVRKGDFSNYHLRLEYKWGEKRYAPRLNEPGNNGLLYHTHGAPGAVWGTWARSVEFEIMAGSVGMVVPVGDGLEVKSGVAIDPAIIDPKQRFMAGAPLGKAVGNTALWNVESHRNADNPIGEWNTLDLYVYANHAVHVVNGVPVMEVWGICDKASESAPCEPLTHGAIQLQSEGAETFFRNITIEPINSLPTIEIR